MSNRNRVLVIVEGDAPKTAIAKAFNQVIERFDREIGEAHVYTANHIDTYYEALYAVQRYGKKEAL